MLPPPPSVSAVARRGSVGGVRYCREPTVVLGVKETGGVKVTAGHSGRVAIHVPVSVMFRVTIETRSCEGENHQLLLSIKKQAKFDKSNI